MERTAAEEIQALKAEIEQLRQEWEATMDCIGDMVFITDAKGKIIRCNRPAMTFFGRDAYDMKGRSLGHLLEEYEFAAGTFFDRGEELFHSPTGRWYQMNVYSIRYGNLQEECSVITIHDITELTSIARDLERANNELKQTQSQMLQQEKMASIGQLAAGVAHEINNPMGFISSNLGTLGKYTDKLSEFINIQSRALESIDDVQKAEELREARKRLKIDYILEDIRELIKESLDGADRVKKIVQDLKSFSRVDEAEYKMADINECIESTLNIVWNELKYKATVHKEYGDIPMTRCYPQQLNQVFMNLLVNASHAIEKQGEITIKTWNSGNTINVSISDTGCGIPEDKINRIFEPFFTTKEVGKGTGLGLSIAYDIIKKHNGEISVQSEVGRGTTFTVKIPVVEEDRK